MFNPSQDLNAIQILIIQDAKILELLDLTGKPNVEIAKRIIKRSQWNDLATNEKRLCIYFVPDRPTRNENFLQSVIQIDIHVPAIHDFKAWEIQERVKVILHKKRINKKYIKFYGQLGELPTMQGFFCCGSRFKFYRTI
ncbi:hypothetical protein ACR77J_11980 [Tissierella praeacuta]|uniref:hypothetical protein n=1 Tax=Tissierella praeacuta TaxID=43131 RepID=UPI003DA61DA2